MALIKIYTEPKNFSQARKDVSKTIKQVAASALDCPTVPTCTKEVETVLIEGLDLVAIDYIMEIIACKRPNMQKIADDIIADLNKAYPDLYFSVYFNLIDSEGMANTPRPSN